MKTAQELYEISKTKAQEIVAEILSGVKEKVILRCEEEAYKGATYYTIRLEQGLSYIKDLLLEECLKIAKEFENNEYKVSIEDHGNGYYINFRMTFSWNNKGTPSSSKLHNYCLYNTDKGIIKEHERISI